MKVLCMLLALICIAPSVYAEGEDDQGEPVPEEVGTVETESQTGTKKVIDFFSTALEFMESGIYEFADSVLERVAAWFIIWQFELKLTFLDVAATIADTIVDSFDIAGKIEKLLGKVDAKVLAFVVWLRIPEALSMMLSAHIVRFILQLF